MSENIKLPEGMFGIKYRTRWSSGYGEWESTLYLMKMTREDAEKNAEAIAEDVNHENNWSEHYRGVDWEILTEYPRDKVDSMLKGTLASIERKKNASKILANLLY